MSRAHYNIKELMSLLEGRIEELLRLIGERTGVKLPRDVIETYLDTEHDLLFIRFREPRGVEVGEPLPLKTPVTLFTEEDTGEVTALEVIGMSKLLTELGLRRPVR
jgi:hypothetical protein